MKHNNTILGITLSLILVFSFILYGFTTSENYQIFINFKNNQTKIENNKVIPLNGEVFELEFQVPKTKDIVTTLYCSDQSEYYYKILKGVNQLSKLEPYQAGRAMSVSISSFTTLDSILKINHTGHQPYAFDGFDFNSFNTVDSTSNSYHLKLNFNAISFNNGNDKIDYQIPDFPKDTIFCVFTLDHDFYKKKNKNQIMCFKLVTR
jgi:hypothetical protein